MVTCRTYLRGFGAFKHITTHEALPLDRGVTLPHSAVLYLLQIMLEALAVTVLDFGDCAEMFGDFRCV